MPKFKPSEGYKSPLSKKIQSTGASPYKLQGHTLPGINQKSPVKQTGVIDSFRRFMKSKQTPEGREMGDIKRRMRHPNLEVRMKAEKEWRAGLKKTREAKAEKDPWKDFTYYDPTKEKPATTGETGKKEFTRTLPSGHPDPYSYRPTKDPEVFEFKEPYGKKGRVKGEWYTAKGGKPALDLIRKAYEASIAGIK